MFSEINDAQIDTTQYCLFADIEFNKLLFSQHVIVSQNHCVIYALLR